MRRRGRAGVRVTEPWHANCDFSRRAMSAYRCATAVLRFRSRNGKARRRACAMRRSTGKNGTAVEAEKTRRARRFGFFRQRKAGFTSVELAMFAAVLLLAASFGVPRFRDAVERSKAGEAFHYLNIVRVAEARHRVRHGTYTERIEETDVNLPPLKFFYAGPLEPGDDGIKDSWRMTLVRRGPAAGYGAYTVTFSQSGFEPEQSTIVAEPTINPFSERSRKVARPDSQPIRAGAFAATD